MDERLVYVGAVAADRRFSPLQGMQPPQGGYEDLVQRSTSQSTVGFRSGLESSDPLGQVRAQFFPRRGMADQALKVENSPCVAQLLGSWRTRHAKLVDQSTKTVDCGQADNA